MKVTAVIGAGYGDEGKGRMVDHFANNNSIVVRFNGGAQAGHTVVLPDGKRHVFHHIGAGTFQGARTYLSKYFISNPVLFRKEVEELRTQFKSQPRIYVSPYSFVTTPWDMMINIIAEENRGEKRYGSCGCGIHETVFRCNGSLLTNVQMLKNGNHNIIDLIWNQYLPERIKELNLTPSESHWKWIQSPNIINNYMEDLKFFIDNVTVEDPNLSAYQYVIFEGAQGLELDQNNVRNFPHVTPSNTGMENVWKLMHDFEPDAAPEIVYVTRSYKTRHGAGPFPEEESAMPNMDDETNIPNAHQGTMRFGLLNVNRLVQAIDKDMDNPMFKGFEFTPSVAVTCLDQYAPHVILDDQEEFFGYEEFCMHILAARLKFSKCYASLGPKAGDRIRVWQRSSSKQEVVQEFAK